MPPAGISMSPGKRRRHRPGSLQRWIIIALKFLLSPMVILADSFRRKDSLDRSWLFAFFLFNSVILGLTGTGILVTEAPMVKTMKMMAAITEDNEILSGDLQPIIRMINTNALENNVDPNLIFAIVKSESNFSATAVSSKGARGIMQIMPDVWQEYRGSSPCSGRHSNRILCHKGECIYSPEANIKVGVKYFKDLLNRFQGRVDLALEAYNAGISNVKPGLSPKYKETKSYVQKTLSFWQDLRKETIAKQLDLTLYLQRGLKVLFGISFLCWLILFWWANQKLFGK
ncbi:MAG: lytic transglycosylase domain-containing protein [Bacillota bacterium]